MLPLPDTRNGGMLLGLYTGTVSELGLCVICRETILGGYEILNKICSEMEEVEADKSKKKKG